jgi:hypothetical protein
VILNILFQLILQVNNILKGVLPVVLGCLLHLVNEVEYLFTLLFQTIEIIL